MPIYEFKCEACAHIDEILMKMSDPTPEKCSICGAKVHKIMSQSSFSLKGTGWYVTDYKNNEKQNKETDSSGPKPINEKTPLESSTSTAPQESTTTPTPTPSATPSDK